VKTTLKDILFADNLCNGDLFSVPAITMASSTVVVRGNLLRHAGNITLNASEWVWSGNTHASGSLEVAAGSKANIVRDNITSAPITDLGAETQIIGNIVMKKTRTP
jgi:hypothetical protein